MKMGLTHNLAKQLRQPEGLLGRFVGYLMTRTNREAIDWTVGLLDIQPSDHVLEVGFGPGLAIEQVARLSSSGRVVGIDFSKEMVKQASVRNAAAIAAGRVELKYGDASALPLGKDSFDKVFAINVIYFWENPIATLTEMRRVMKVGGRLVLYMVSKEDLAKMKSTRTGVFTTYTNEQAVQWLTQAGFNRVQFKTKAEKARTGVCVLAEK